MGPEGVGAEEGRPYPSNVLRGNAYHPSFSCHAPHSLNIHYPTPVSVMEGTRSCPSCINLIQIFWGSELPHF